MSLWTIKAYYLANGTCPMRNWYTAQDVEVQAQFDATLATLVATEDWEDRDTKQFKVLRADHVGLGEIRFKIEEWQRGVRGRTKLVRRFRPVGIWPPVVEREFILLLGCEKSRGVYIPDDAFTLALEYKRRLEAGEGEANEYR
jgi:hypothetical protein